MCKIGLRFAIAAVLPVLLFGCGGGAGTAGGGGGGGTLTDKQRTAALTAAGTKFDSLNSLAPADANQQMANYLKQQAQFEAAGVSDDSCAWGRFKDGRVAIFVNNRKLPAQPLVVRSMQGTRAAGTPSNLPENPDVYIDDILGSDWSNLGGVYPAWFQQKKYNPRIGSTPAGLEGVVDTGLFYINSHGGSGQWLDGTKAYAVWTSLKRSDDQDVSLKDDLDSRRLAYMYAKGDKDPSGNWISTWRYAFTASFVTKYMSFTQNSLVFIDACSSDEAGFKAACIAKGASVYCGWSQDVDSDKALTASSMLFDRLLGLNTQAPVEEPKQRAFDWKSVYTWMQQNGYDVGHGTNGCHLEMTQGSGSGSGFGLFTPSIAYMTVDVLKGELNIWGLFGENPGANGKVTVAGAPLKVVTWDRDPHVAAGIDKIVCTLPDTGAGSFGDVTVTVRDHESNTRQLSLYEPRFTVTHDTGDGRKYVLNIGMRFRVDLQSTRTKPGDAPKYSPQSVVSCEKTTNNYQFSGVYIFPDGGSTAWSGSGALKNQWFEATAAQGYVASIKFDPEAHIAWFSLGGGMDDALTITETDQEGNKNSYIRSVPIGFDTFDTPQAATHTWVQLTLDSEYNIRNGSSTAKTVEPTYGWNGNTDTAKIEWSAATCQSAPKDDTPRSIALPRSRAVRR